ncbi:lantibiotic dehydratase [Chitinophaga qingshengii]|uniref:Lantibiotic dehydratase n=1 Tax=Chitinophaga qingshengii TaxID=1569794 RepID=A0ABR7TUQ4_9BACT|nr:lantibiotic dehydratase [Chitinophaga qingshengii]MBC9934222.1 lantibiotic dehydratase [Chitinophaga qingshengii]
MALSHTGFFLLRSPLYPVNRYRDVLQDSLQELADKNPLFLYALCIASGELLKELERFLSDPASFNKKKTDKLRKSLYKYWVRACSRSTPYGLFAGCTTGTVGTDTQLQLNDMKDAYQYVRLDMDYYTRICYHISQQPGISTALRYYPNNSIYKTGDKYRYAEYTITNNRRKYLLTAVEDSVFMTAIIREAAAGLTIAQIVQIIHEQDPSVTEEEASGFVRELIESQLLIADTEPRITGKDNLQFLTDRLLSIPDASTFRDALLALQQLFDKQDYERSRLSAIHQQCENAFPVSIPKDLLQIDLFKTAQRCQLSETLVNDIVSQIHRLLSLCHGFAKGQSEMSSFITRFQERYESQEVPLNLVLDGETGIGYGAAIENTVHAPFVEDVAGGGAETQIQSVSWSPIQQLALDKYEQFLQQNLPEVSITDEDLQKLGDPETVNMARSCYLFGSLHAASAEAADKGDYRFAMSSMGGPSAANLLGRFCNGDAALTEKVKAVLDEEAAAFPDVILAEVVHFPEARAANVLIRPTLRPYEIPYVGVAGTTEEYQIPIADISVSVRNNEVVLRSRRLNKRVIPRLSSAHNYGFNSLPVYKFLCDLQHQSITGFMAWDWGVFASRKRLPRVVYKNIILARASWTLTAKDVEHLGDDAEANQRFLDQYREQQQMPAKVMLSEADNELLLDLTAPAAVSLLIEHVKKTTSLKLKECLLPEDAGIVRDTNNQVYTNEVLVPLRCVPVPEKAAAGKPAVEKAVVQNPRPAAPVATAAALPLRSFAPGSEWLYVKVYCGFRIAEELLATWFAEHLPQWQEDGLFEEFFFLRYGDPLPHIRLRFRNSRQPGNNNEILHRIQAGLQPLVNNGQVSKIQCDTYIRELERYGAFTMPLSEQLFSADSMAVLGIVSMLEGAEGESYRWRMALRGTDMLLEDFGLTPTERKQLLAALREGFTNEFGGAKVQHKALNDKYRKHQQEIASFLRAENDVNNEIAEAVELFRQRSAITAPLAQQIREHYQNDQRYFDILASHIHMFLNRIFVAKQRKHEMVIYHFLEKYYLSQLAMEATLK